jgi:AcrR family transcriptional regulator
MSAPLDRRRGTHRGDERRAALLRALDELLQDATSLEEINVADLSRRAGVTRSAFYFYFESKATAAAALLEELYDDAAGGTDLLVDAEGDPDVRIHKVIASLFDAVDRRPHAYRAVLEARATSATVREVWDTERAGFARAVAGMITAERSAGRAPAGADAEALAQVLLELNDRAVERYALGGGPPREAHLEALTSIWLRSIYCPPPRSKHTRRTR